MGCCDSGGGNGGTRFEWNDAIAPYWAQTLQDASGSASQPFSRDPNQRIAYQNSDIQTAMQELRNMNGMTRSPMDAINGAIGQTSDTLSGRYLDGAGQDPYAGSSNPYRGFSPQFNAMTQAGRDDITNSYNQGTAADTTRLFNMSGAFGGSAHQNAMANNQTALAKQLGQYTSGMQNDQWARSGELANSDLNRGSAAWQGERGRQMGAVGLGNDQQGLGFQRASALMGVGDAQRTYEQQFLDMNHNDYLDSQNWGRNRDSWMAGILSGAQGGLPPSQISTPAAYSASPFSSILGSALSAYGMFGNR